MVAAVFWSPTTLCFTASHCTGPLTEKLLGQNQQYSTVEAPVERIPKSLQQIFGCTPFHL
jgi:hypothetical protein